MLWLPLNLSCLGFTWLLVSIFLCLSPNLEHDQILFPWTFLPYTFSSTSFKKYFIYLAVSGLSCGMRDLVPWPGIKPGPPALGAQSLRHWTTREVPFSSSETPIIQRWSPLLLSHRSARFYSIFLILFFFFLKNSFTFKAKSRWRNRDFPHTPCPYTCTASPIINIPHKMERLLQLVSPRWHIIITRITQSPFCFMRSMSLDKCMMTCVQIIALFSLL